MASGQRVWASSQLASGFGSFGANVVKLSGSALTQTLHGGALLVFLDIAVSPTFAGTIVCVPLIDDAWAGSFVQSPPAAPEAPVSISAAARWSRTRVYANVPAGDHEIAVRCTYDAGFDTFATYCADQCTWAAIELGS
jgi:hypothetical protein